MKEQNFAINDEEIESARSPMTERLNLNADRVPVMLPIS